MKQIKLNLHIICSCNVLVRSMPFHILNFKVFYK
jgi:hypothetical protein